MALVSIKLSPGAQISRIVQEMRDRDASSLAGGVRRSEVYGSCLGWTDEHCFMGPTEKFLGTGVEEFLEKRAMVLNDFLVSSTRNGAHFVTK